jgi:hypothetical protein
MARGDDMLLARCLHTNQSLREVVFPYVRENGAIVPVYPNSAFDIVLASRNQQLQFFSPGWDEPMEVMCRKNAQTDARIKSNWLRVWLWIALSNSEINSKVNSKLNAPASSAGDREGMVGMIEHFADLGTFSVSFAMPAAIPMLNLERFGRSLYFCNETKAGKRG